MLSAMMECEHCWGGLLQIPHQYIAQGKMIAVRLSEQPELTTTVLDGINRQSYIKVKAAQAERKSAKGYLLENAWRHVETPVPCEQ
jgi:hypothetical protein